MNRLLETLRARGWRVVRRDATAALLPAHLAARYAWLDREVIDALAGLETCSSRDETAWFLTATDYGRSPGDEQGFRWNEYEIMAVEAAEGDASMIRDIHAFWDHHFPFALAVHSDHDYLAIRAGDGAVVHGCAPEWEEPTEVAPSFAAFLEAFEKELTGEPQFPFSLFLGQDA